MMRAGGRTFAWATMSLTAAALYSGCGTSPSSRFYVLAPSAEGTPKAEAAAGAEADGETVLLVVSAVEVASYLDRPQIVTRSGENEVALAEFDRWAQPLKESLPTLIARNLSAFLGSERVFGSRDLVLGEPKFLVDVSVLRFDGLVGGEVVLDARWLLVDGGARAILAMRRSRIVKPSGGGGYGALVAAMSDAVGDLSLEIAKAVKEARLEPQQEAPGKGESRAKA